MQRGLSELLSGRWQIPLALVAATAAGISMYKLIPAPARPPLDMLLGDIALLEQAGDNVAAADALANVLAVQPPPPPAEQAVLHDRLAGVLFAIERGATEHNANNLAKLLEHDARARALGLAAGPAAALRAAFAQRWLGHDEAAIEAFRAALGTDLAPADRRAAIKSSVELLERHSLGRSERRELLEELLRDEATPPAYVWWGLQRLVQRSLDEQDTLAARQALDRFGARLATSDLKGYLEYLWAAVMLAEGRVEEAAPLVRWVDDWVEGQSRHRRALDDVGHLPTMNRWLLGRINLAQGQPEAAREDFEYVLEQRPRAALALAAASGRGAALAALGRHGQAAEAFTAAAGLAQEPEVSAAARRELARSLVKLFERVTAEGADQAALAYLALAPQVLPPSAAEEREQLIEQLGQAFADAARRTSDAVAQQDLRGRAAAALSQAADEARFDPSRGGDLLWAAAEQYDAIGDTATMRRLLERFVSSRSGHPQMPAALLQLGRACELAGEPDEALRWYQRVIAEYPQLEQAARAKVLWAGVLATRGEAQRAEAERLLDELLSGEQVSPDAQVYRDALLTLCELLYYQGRYGEAIGRLDEFLQHYPQDPERTRARFMCADAYRRSALALRAAEPGEARQAEGRRRLARAAELYADLIAAVDAGPGAPAEAEALYTRLAHFYRGDCLFELNEPTSLDEALAAYRTAGMRYEGQPEALTAQVQIANTLLRLGDVRGAGRALESARWTLRTIPDAAAGFTADRRAAWEQVLGVAAGSELFADLASRTP